MIARWRRGLALGVGLLALAVAAGAEPAAKKNKKGQPGAGEEAKHSGQDEAAEKAVFEAFRIFLNVKQHLVEQCIAKPTDLDVVRGALDALQRELSPELAPSFPPTLATDFKGAFKQYQEAIRKLARQPDVGRTVKQLVEQSVRAYSRKLYRFSDYDDLATVERETVLRKSNYSGVGMTLDRTLEGIDCYPFIGEPASLAGVQAGDRLLEVDGQTVRGLTVIDAGAMIAGAPGTAVALTLRRRGGTKEETVTVKRGKIIKSAIAIDMVAGVPRVRFGRLSPESVEELKIFLRTVKPGTPLTLDLRGCPGGELESAVGIAECFLPAGKVICRVQTRVQRDEFVSKNETPFRPRPFVILQDRGTASGAELIIVALASDPALALGTRGERSFGKGFTLSDVEIGNGGGRLRFAEGRIYGPNGETWDREGLDPAIEEPPAR